MKVTQPTARSTRSCEAEVAREITTEATPRPCRVNLDSGSPSVRRRVRRSDAHRQETCHESLDGTGQDAGVRPRRPDGQPAFGNDADRPTALGRANTTRPVGTTARSTSPPVGGKWTAMIFLRDGTVDQHPGTVNGAVHRRRTFGAVDSVAPSSAERSLRGRPSVHTAETLRAAGGRLNPRRARGTAATIVPARCGHAHHQREDLIYSGNLIGGNGSRRLPLQPAQLDTLEPAGPAREPELDALVCGSRTVRAGCCPTPTLIRARDRAAPDHAADRVTPRRAPPRRPGVANSRAWSTCRQRSTRSEARCHDQLALHWAR